MTYIGGKLGPRWYCGLGNDAIGHGVPGDVVSLLGLDESVVPWVGSVKVQ